MRSLPLFSSGPQTGAKARLASVCGLVCSTNSSGFDFWLWKSCWSLLLWSDQSLSWRFGRFHPAGIWDDLRLNPMKLLCAILKPRPKCNGRIDPSPVCEPGSVFLVCLCVLILDRLLRLCYFLPLWFQHPCCCCCRCCFWPPSRFNLCCCVFHACSVVLHVKCSF